MAGLGSTFKIVKLTYFTKKTAIAVFSARKLFNCSGSTCISISMLQCIYRISQKQVPDRNKKKQRLVPSNDFRWWWWQVAGGEGFLLHNNVKTAPTLIHILISTRNFLRDTLYFLPFSLILVHFHLLHPLSLCNLILRILLKQNTALLSTVRVRPSISVSRAWHLKFLTYIKA